MDRAGNLAAASAAYARLDVRMLRSWKLCGSSAVLVWACGGSPARDFGVLDRARWAREDAQGIGRSVCFDQVRYSAERGCVFDGPGRPVRIRHRDAMGSAFRLVGAAYALDGAIVFDTNDPELLSRRDFPVFESYLRSGHHELAVLLRYRGHGAGVFSYLAGYRFDAREVFSLSVPDSGGAFVVVGDEAGDPAVPLEKRPQIHLTVDAPR